MCDCAKNCDNDFDKQHLFGCKCNNSSIKFNHFNCDPKPHCNDFKTTSQMTYVDMHYKPICDDKPKDHCKPNCPDTDKCEPCLSWGPFVDNNITAVSTNAFLSVNQVGPVGVTNLLNMNLYVDCVVKKISELPISKCAKQNLIASILNPFPVNMLTALISTTSAIFPDTYIVPMNLFMTGLSMKWTLYVESELNCTMSGTKLKTLKTNFFTQISTSEILPKIIPVNSADPAPTPISTTPITDFVKNTILKNC